MRKSRYLIPVLLFLLYAGSVFLGAWFLAPAAVFFLVVFVLIALGLTVLVVYLIVAKLNRPPAPAADSSGQGNEKVVPTRPGTLDDADRASFVALIGEANQRLAKSPKLASRGVKTNVTKLPLYLIGGTEGAGKTSTFLKSGLEVELLAGQVFRDSNIVPTRLANLWFSEDCLFTELSGTLFSGDTGRWSGILGLLQGRSAAGFLKKIFGSKGQVQLRGFILVCDITPFVGVPDTSRLSGLARRMQERMRLVGESFGTNFPVYVVFTKSDSIPYFAEYFAHLLESEDQQILGCTLPAVIPGTRSGTDVYAEAETARLSEAFNQLYYSLADKRLAMLPRETNAASKAGTYEFPREMKRIRDTIVQLLADVFRPNPLQAGPILRGYYFTGTRQVTVSALGPAVGDPVARSSASEATSLFNLAEYQKKMGLVQEAPTNQAETTVQRWSFIADLFHSVILPDPMTRAVAFASSRHAMYKRILFGAAAGLGLLLCLLWIRSWWDNRDLLEGVETAAQTSYTFRVQPGARAVPSLETLNGLEALRAQLETLLDYDRNGAPWRMRWGLYAGDRVLPSTRTLYFQRFRQIFFDEISGSISGTLAQLPSSPDARNSYNATYDRLKAYRMITQCKCTPDPAFLTRFLSEIWLTGRNIDEPRQALAQKQIAFYADELKIENPYKVEESQDLVAKGQRYLNLIGGVERIYRNIIEAANKSPHSPARLVDLAPDYKKVLISSPGEVQAAFTRSDGWSFVEEQIKNPDNTSLGEQCVIGARNLGAQALQSTQTEGDLRTLYLRDYIRAWRDFANSTTVAPFNGLADASSKLETLASNRSPLLAAVFMIADNTNFPATPKDPAIPAAVMNKIPAGVKKGIDVAKQVMASRPTASPGDVARLFQPARAVISVENRDSWINEPNQQYMAKLGNLQLAMQKLKDGNSSRPDPAATKEADDAVTAGLGQANAIAQKFNREGDDLKWLTDMVNSDVHRDSVDIPLRKLLEAPFKEAQKVIPVPGKFDIQTSGAAAKKFCTDLSKVEGKFPFNPLTDNDATLSEVVGIFAPQSSSLSALQQQVNKFVTKPGKEWVPNTNAETQPNRDFVKFMNSMQKIQDVLFVDGSPQPKMRYALKPLPDQIVESITLTIDGTKFTATRGKAESQQLSWSGQSGQVTATIQASGSRAFGNYSSPWALWHWMYDADMHAPGSKIREWSTTRQSHGQPQDAGTDAQGRKIVMRVEISEPPSGYDAFERGFFSPKCVSKVTE
jgi:type VI secretion system protein ImpL